MSPVDVERLKGEAKQLKALLEACPDPAADEMLRALKPLLDAAQVGDLRAPIRTVPGGWQFHEGTLRQYPELEEAYAQLSATATGVDRAELRDFFERLGAT